MPKTTQASARRYAEMRFSDSHIKRHTCRACKTTVSGVFVAAVYRGGRGNWLWDAFHLPCAAGAEPQLARDLFEHPRPRHLAGRASELGPCVSDVRLDPSTPALANRELRDVGRLFRFARGGVCALCGRTIDGVGISAPRITMGDTAWVAFHLACTLATGEVTAEEIVERIVESTTEDPTLAAEARAALGPMDAATRAVASSATPPAHSVRLFGVDRRSARRDELRWDLCFCRPAARERVEALVRGVWRWEQSTLAEVRPQARATTLSFRDAVAAQAEALAREGLEAAHFCGAGDIALSRAPARIAAGLAPFPFDFIGRGQHPVGPEWRVRVAFREPPPETVTRLVHARWFEDATLRGRWLSFRARYRAIAPEAPYQSALRDGLDEVLHALHAAAPIALAVLGGQDNAGQADAWHDASLGRADRALLAEVLAPTPVTRLSPAQVAALRDEAREAHAHADEMGDPKAAAEGLAEILTRIPASEHELRREVSKLYDEALACSLPPETTAPRAAARRRGRSSR